MTDKQYFEKDINVPSKEQIMIDGVNVNRCIDFNKRDKVSCYHILYDKCNESPNCYFKQLYRKTQECVELNNEIIDMNSIIEDAAINLGNKDFTLYDLPFEIKKLRQECERLKIYIESNEQQVKEVETLVMDNDRLINELDQLKAENEKLKESLKVWQYSDVQHIFEIKKYEQTLAEIKKIIQSDYCTEIGSCEFCAEVGNCLNRKILQKISEVE